MRNNAQYLFSLYCALLRNKTGKVNLGEILEGTGIGTGILGLSTKLLLFRLKIRMNFVEVAGRVDIIIGSSHKCVHENCHAS